MWSKFVRFKICNHVFDGLCRFFLRFDELVNIRRNDILFEEKQIKLFIQKSKTDQLKNGSCVSYSKNGKGYVSGQVS